MAAEKPERIELLESKLSVDLMAVHHAIEG
jgi:hypothetical protein